jgi:hypothetical protein
MIHKTQTASDEVKPINHKHKKCTKIPQKVIANLACEEENIIYGALVSVVICRNARMHSAGTVYAVWSSRSKVLLDRIILKNINMHLEIIVQ